MSSKSVQIKTVLQVGSFREWPECQFSGIGALNEPPSYPVASVAARLLVLTMIVGSRLLRYHGAMGRERWARIS